MKAKKHLGQHFLTARSAAEALAEAADIKTGEMVLEIGPGTGILTESLLARGARVMAVEKDNELIPILQDRFAKELASKQLLLLEGDISSFDPTPLGSYKIAANIPYYLTGDILRRFLSGESQPSSMTLMVQREVATRILARDKKESLLSLSVKAYGTPSIVKKVPAGSFSPPPKVDSAIIHIQDISRDFFKDTDEEFFFRALKAGFAHKRKQLAGNLSSFGSSKEISAALHSIGHSPKARAEDITLAEWGTLAQNLSKLGK